jgi:hypothetical protein
MITSAFKTKIAKVALSIVALAAILILAGEGANLLPIAFNDLIGRSAYIEFTRDEIYFHSKKSWFSPERSCRIALRPSEDGDRGWVILRGIKMKTGEEIDQELHGDAFYLRWPAEYY